MSVFNDGLFVRSDEGVGGGGYEQEQCGFAAIHLIDIERSRVAASGEICAVKPVLFELVCTEFNHGIYFY